MFSRRDALLMGAAAAAALGLPLGRAEAAQLQEAIDAFTGGSEAAEGGLELTAPEIAENGNTVPITISAEGAASVTVLAAGNPNAEVVTFHFGPLAGSRTASTRIRLAQTQDLYAVAKMEDGSFRMVSRNVKVTIGGCGG